MVTPRAVAAMPRTGARSADGARRRAARRTVPAARRPEPTQARVTAAPRSRRPIITALQPPPRGACSARSCRGRRAASASEGSFKGGRRIHHKGISSVVHRNFKAVKKAAAAALLSVDAKIAKIASHARGVNAEPPTHRAVRAECESMRSRHCPERAGPTERGMPADRPVSALPHACPQKRAAARHEMRKRSDRIRQALSACLSCGGGILVVTNNRICQNLPRMIQLADFAYPFLKRSLRHRCCAPLRRTERARRPARAPIRPPDTLRKPG